MATKVMPAEPNAEPSSEQSSEGTAAKNPQDATKAGTNTPLIAEPTVRSIIDAARKAPAKPFGALGLSVLTGVCTWASFMPLNWSPLAWLCLVPLILLVRIERRTQYMYRCVLIGGLTFTIPALSWMPAGDPSMFPAWIALATYMALYFPLFVALTRIAVHRFNMPLTLAVPIVWTGTEYLRATVMTGFAWYFLAHTQYRWISLIQISDIVGAYGVSFVITMMAACLALLVPNSWIKRFGLLPPTKLPDDFKHLPEEGIDPAEDAARIFRRNGWNVAICASIFAAVLVYGEIRKRQVEFEPGPRIALIQGNFPSSLKHDPSIWRKMFRYHDALTGMAVGEQPDVVVWPETMFRWPLRVMEGELTDDQLVKIAPGLPQADRVDWIQSWRSNQIPETLENMSLQSGAAMVIGIDTFYAKSDKLERFNSAAFIRPDLGLTGRYDKIHRVVFGEYIPLQKELPWLHNLTPFSANHGIQKGDSYQVFEHNGYRYSPVICFEDTVPHLVRDMIKKSNEIVGQEPIDCLINVTNDGWFSDTAEIEQHLFTSVFRCVECRTPMVRAVNTGISAFIDGNGNIIEPDAFIDGERRPVVDSKRQAKKDVKPEVTKPPRKSMKDPKTGEYHKSLNAALVSNVPLDKRSSLYVAHGDWFASSAAFCSILLGFCGFLPRKEEEKVK